MRLADLYDKACPPHLSPPLNWGWAGRRNPPPPPPPPFQHLQLYSHPCFLCHRFLLGLTLRVYNRLLLRPPPPPLLLLTVFSPCLICTWIILRARPSYAVVYVSWTDRPAVTTHHSASKQPRRTSFWRVERI
jgi:hypothetical protein